MAKSTPRPPAVLLKSIGTHAESVRDAAALLTQRIEEFQAYLGKLPGRVEAYCHIPDPDADYEDAAYRSVCLHLHREGKQWTLSYGHGDDRINDPENPIVFKPLTDAPLKVKIAAVKGFPDLLESVEKSQATLLNSISDALEEYDEFSASLKSEQKEGK